MNQAPTKFPWTIALGLLLVLLCLALSFVYAGLRARLAHRPALPDYGSVADFTLTNQSGNAVSLADLRGQVWIADIIFTRCAGPCLRMSRQMAEMQSALSPKSRVKLVSLTTDPDYDTPAVLATYAARFDADHQRWLFLTGTKGEIGKLATEGLKLSAVEKAPAERESPEDLFIHSTLFVVVDKKGRLRGTYETGGEGVSWSNEKKNILAAAAQLERER